MLLQIKTFISTSPKLMLQKLRIFTSTTSDFVTLVHTYCNSKSNSKYKFVRL